VTDWTVLYGKRARAHLASIFDFVIEKTESPKIAGDYVDRIMARIDRLALTPQVGTVGLDRWGPNVRTIGFERRVTIAFRLDHAARTITVLAVLYAGRTDRGG
jgi:toxin ParE1/3/4